MNAYTLESGVYKSANGLASIVWHLYLPIERVRAVVQLSHGMCEYVARYEPLANYLCKEGIALWGNDHIGHGQSQRSEQELGFFGDHGWQSEVENMHILTEMIKERFPSLPLILLGHSMGSLLARAYLEIYPHAVTAACICGTSGKLAAAPLGMLCASLVSLFKGGKYRSEALHKLIFGSYNDRIIGRRTSFDWLTHDDKIVDRYIADPKCNFVFTANGFYNLTALLHHVSRRRTFEATAPLPLLFLSGSVDPVGQYSKGVLQTASRYSAAGFSDITLRLYAGGRHEIFNETESLPVFEDFYRFVLRFIY